MSRQHRLDFGKLDAEATDLDLAVPPTEQLKHASLSPSGPVPCRVHSRTRLTVRVGHEPLGRLTRVGHVAPRHAGSSDIQIAENSGGDRLEVLVQNVGTRAGQRPSDRHRSITLEFS